MLLFIYLSQKNNPGKLFFVLSSKYEHYKFWLPYDNEIHSSITQAIIHDEKQYGTIQKQEMLLQF